MGWQRNRPVLVNVNARPFVFLARCITIFTPGLGQGDFYRFSGINDTVSNTFKAWENKGTAELLQAVRTFVTGAPGTLVQPLAPG